MVCILRSPQSPFSQAQTWKAGAIARPLLEMRARGSYLHQGDCELLAGKKEGSRYRTHHSLHTRASSAGIPAGGEYFARPVLSYHDLALCATILRCPLYNMES